MFVKSFNTPRIEDIAAAIKEADRNPEIKSIIVLSCDENQIPKDIWDKTLKDVKTTIFGGIFPKIFHYRSVMDKGHIIACLKEEFTIDVIKEISSDSRSIEEQVSAIKLDKETKSRYVFLDGLSTQIASLIESLYNNWGLESNYVGGGAGSLSFQRKPCLITNKGLLEDSCIIASSKNESKIGVAHGWKKISDTLRFTEVDKTKIVSLDFEPAFEVYKKVIEAFSGEVMTEDNFFEIARSFPFGISINGEENIVRDPVMLEGNSIVCIGEVPADSYAHILNGKSQDLIKAAEQAHNMSHLEENSIKICFDCISRALFMGDKFEEELIKISGDDTNSIGALSIGEIANSGDDYLEFYNKTIVVSNLKAA